MNFGKTCGILSMISREKNVGRTRTTYNIFKLKFTISTMLRTFLMYQLRCFSILNNSLILSRGGLTSKLILVSNHNLPYSKSYYHFVCLIKYFSRCYWHGN